MSLLRKLVCKIRGHRRGSRADTVNGISKFVCPRCGACWARKDRKPKVAA